MVLLVGHPPPPPPLPECMPGHPAAGHTEQSGQLHARPSLAAAYALAADVCECCHQGPPSENSNSLGCLPTCQYIKDRTAWLGTDGFSVSKSGCTMHAQYLNQGTLISSCLQLLSALDSLPGRVALLVLEPDPHFGPQCLLSIIMLLMILVSIPVRLLSLHPVIGSNHTSYKPECLHTRSLNGTNSASLQGLKGR